MEPNWKSSLRLYLPASGWLGVAMTIAFLSGVGGLITDAVFGVSPLHMPWWGWTVLLVCIALIAPFQAFHKMNIKLFKLESQIAVDMVLGETSDGFDVMEQMYVAGIAVSHNGKGTAVNAGVAVEGFAPISKDPFVTEMCRNLAPIALWPKHCDKSYPLAQQHADYGQFDVHATVPLTVDIAFLVQPQSNNATPFFIFGPRISRSAHMPAGDYIVVLVTTARHATPARMAFTVGDADGESGRPSHVKRRIVIKPLRKSIASVLGDDHWLAKKFDEQIVPHPRAAS
jgi:hypothetical protein